MDQDPAGRVGTLVEPLLAAIGIELFDVELKAGVLRVSIDREGGVDLDAITTATQRINEALDTADPDPVPGSYSLEVSSPGLERPLRTPAHFRRYVGTTVSVKTRPDVEGERRFEGPLDAADDEGITVAGRRLAFADIDRARTVFEWGGQPKKNPNRKKAAS
ncbi:MAG: ribosome maturation factor RimP [Acidimicrobiaceae bacterium]|nr:ribosome maturation factor RimP [Acidimicrobiaceae bacterium]